MIIAINWVMTSDDVPENKYNQFAVWEIQDHLQIISLKIILFLLICNLSLSLYYFSSENNLNLC